MTTRQNILDTLCTIPDPEMPISIVDLGLVHNVRMSKRPAATLSHAQECEDVALLVHVELLPTFIGCPALEMIASEVRAKVGALPGVERVEVNWLFDPPWSVDRISPAGRAALREHGVTVPPRVTLRTSAVRCPFCGSGSTTLDSPFGPTRCRMIYYCESCRNSFEHMKTV